MSLIGLAARGAAVIGCVAFIGLGGRDLNGRYDRARRVLDDEAIPRPGVARVLSLGHTEWVTDILWINATLYYGEALYARLPITYARRYTETMTDLDPRFRQAYAWGAMAMTYRAVNTTADEARAAVGLLRRGVAAFPGDPELLGQLGIYLSIEYAPLLPRDSDERRRARVEASESLRRATASGWGGPWEALLAARLLAEFGRLDPAIEVLRDVLARTEDPRVRATIEERLGLYMQRRGSDDAFTATLRGFEVERRAHAPWMHPTLYVFVGSGNLDRRGERGGDDHSSGRLR